MTTEELVNLPPSTPVMNVHTVVIYQRMQDYPDKQLVGLYFNTEKGTVVHASYLENEVVRCQ